MALPLAPMITAGASLVGTGASAYSTGKQNKKSRRFSREMYDRTKADNLEFWHMANEYNSPQAQMQRFQEAGLNPNLIYGQGSHGNTSPMPTPDVQPAQFRVPEFGDVGNAAAQYFDTEIKLAQVDNIKSQTQVNQETALLRALQTHGEGYKNASHEVKARLDTELYEISADHARESLRKLKADTQYTLDQNERAMAMLQPNLQNAIEDILTKRLGREVSAQQLRNLGLDNEVKQLDARLAKMGIRPTDPFYAKAVGQLIGLVMQKLGHTPNFKY